MDEDGDGGKLNWQRAMVPIGTDKAKAVKAALLHPNGAQMSDTSIGEYVGVDVKTVSKYRAELESTMEIPESNIRQGADGRTIDTSNIGKTKTVETAGESPKESPTKTSRFLSGTRFAGQLRKILRDGKVRELPVN